MRTFVDRTAQDEEVVREIRAVATPLEGDRDLDPLLDRIGNARYVLLGEASHGTHEYYTWRARLSRRLIREKGFSFISVEGDWPDCYRVNCYVKGEDGLGKSAREVLHAFERWPTWMWANEEVVDLAEWLREHNQSLAPERKVGFYGLDVYSLWDSLQAVLDYLARVDGSAVEAARQAFHCFEPYGEDPQTYAWSTMITPTNCRDAVVEALVQLRRSAPVLQSAAIDGREAYFNAEQNALVAQNAERYYRTMVQGGPASWNVRDHHMMETLDRLMRHHGPETKGIVWEHNTHVGDARATDMAGAGMFNIGQLARERHEGEGVVLVGFGSYEGSVIAGRRWGARMERLPVPPAQAGSYEDLLHRAGRQDLLLLLTGDTPAPPSLRETRGHRAIGVVYNPENEAWGNYVPTRLAERYDAFLYVDRTQALRPLHMPVRAERDLPETFPSGV
ncbi:MAG TPA: erythromycin esterase family protein [Armatimonadota bacterium]|nr:erythromycin esterase family protein [Armatimonadota bacterium]